MHAISKSENTLKNVDQKVMLNVKWISKFIGFFTISRSRSMQNSYSSFIQKINIVIHCKMDSLSVY